MYCLVKPAIDLKLVKILSDECKWVSGQSSNVCHSCWGSIIVTKLQAHQFHTALVSQRKTVPFIGVNRASVLCHRTWGCTWIVSTYHWYCNNNCVLHSKFCWLTVRSRKVTIVAESRGRGYRNMESSLLYSNILATCSYRYCTWCISISNVFANNFPSESVLGF